jgi:hypothetical protein
VWVRRVWAELRIALLGAWAGSMLSFAALVVPAAFAHLPTFLAASVLAPGFRGLDRGGMAVGLACALIGAFEIPRSRAIWDGLRAALPLVGGICHALSYFWVGPGIAELRELAGGSVGQLAASAPEVERFRELHALSRALFAASALIALGACAWDVGALAGKDPRPREPEKTS